MSDAPELDAPSLPFWMAGAEADKLAAAAKEWFARLGEAAALPAKQLDPLSCSASILDLLAWQRGISAYKGEPERSYRLRVAYAYANARDAGSVNGWARIFQRLEVGDVELQERIAGQDWDIIGIVLDDERLAACQGLVEIIVKDYGRTCRRYHLVSRITATATCGHGTFDLDHSTVCASVPPLAVRARLGTFDNQYSTVEARA
ncbi:tail protein I [Desulfovibrio sp. X2]|uniref:phage tail protein n=1 Tax=Desulfovibrio sp. X2 TaxID=941449 RepID=UPI0003588F75|nr:phage tail protein [Desulfovibrio sp. X2]EPR43145.1 tail protein I [Desulfovibrio sp. X2]